MYAKVNPQGDAGTEECTEIASALGPILKHKIRESLEPLGTTRGQENALSMKVCDPQLVAMLPMLGAEIAETPEFREVAKLFKRGEDDVSTMSLLKSLISSGANGGP